jgi:hypothetical protein
MDYLATPQELRAEIARCRSLRLLATDHLLEQALEDRIAECEQRLADIVAAEKGPTMSDDKNSQDGRDRSRVAGDEPYEVQYFADKHGISREEARELIATIGNDRTELDKAARELKGR